jgi:Domain of unknown function (DUF4419)
MLDYIQSILNKVRRRDNSLRLNEPFQDKKTEATQGGEKNKRQTILADIVPTGSGSTGIAFSVDKVVPTQVRLPETTLLENLKMRCGTSVLVLPEQTSPAVEPEGFLASTKNDQLDGHRFLNPLIEAVHLAFSAHRPLVLSPDCIWLTIVQGFGHHVKGNAETLRERIVRHEGQKDLRVRIESLEPGVWPYLTSELSAQIRDNSDPVLHETLLCDFSTTTPNVKVANEIALMDAYQRYFLFTSECICGIPTITLEGNPEDWQRIRNRVDLLTTFGLEWWTSRLAPILDEFVATANGSPDLPFWQAIYKPKRTYETDMATGWIADLFPYLSDGARMRNPLMGKNRTDWVLPEPNFEHTCSAIPLNSMPTGLSSAPLTLEFLDKPPIELNLLGGFFGVSQSAEDLSLAPIISWAVAEKDERMKPASAEAERAR